MIEETVPAEAASKDLDPVHEPALIRLEARLARAEAQLRTLGDRVAEMHEGERARKQRALLVRLGLLALLLGLFFVVQFMKGRG